MNNIKNYLIPIFELFISSILLIKELYQMTVLPSIHDKTLEFVDFIKYKENTYSLIFLWTLVLMTGIIGLTNKQNRWFANQSLIIAFLLGTVIPVIFSFAYDSLDWIAWGLVIIGILIIQYIFYKSSITQKATLTRTNVTTCIMLGLISALVFWTIELTRLSYSLSEVI